MIATGAADASIPSRQVRSPLWLRSTSVRVALSSATTSRPKSESPPFSGTIDPCPSWLGAVVRELDDLDAEPREDGDPPRVVPHHGPVLEPLDDADPALAGGTLNVARPP